MNERFGRCYWPGALSCSSATYTIGHGIAPAACVFTINPQPVFPALVGDVIFDDGFATVKIPRCKIDKVNVRVDSGGEVWDLIILDRRWRWKELGAISGVYNVVDPNGKVLPWTEKTPKQLAELCLQALGEKGYTIKLPPVSVNPPVNWDYVPPAQALSALAESLGCRVIYRLDTDTILVAPPGEGEQLPPGSIQSEGPSLDSPERPDRIVIAGQPVRFQARFRLEAVGEDWNGEIKPLKDLSYAPEGPAVAVPHKVVITPAIGSVSANDDFLVILADVAGEKRFAFTATVASVGNVTAGLTADINAGAAGGWPWTAVDNGTSLTVTGPAIGWPFSVVAQAFAGGAGTPLITWEATVQGQVVGQDPWLYCKPPLFSATIDPRIRDVKATDRVTKDQAKELAKKSVFRYYRITTEASGTGERGPLRIPEYTDPIVRKEQIVLHQTKAQPIEPSEPNAAVLDDLLRKRKLNEFYNGHTRDKPAVCIGSYFIGTSAAINTPANREVMVEFSIDVQRQLVIFSQYVFFLGPDTIKAADIVLETGCNVRDADTNALVTIEGFADLGPPVFNTPPLYVRREDVQATVLGIYDEKNKLTASLTDYPEAKAKIAYYLQAYAKRYRSDVALNRTYNGLMPIWLDGAIQQVTWTVNEQGCETQASRNSEHHPYIPPYPVLLKNGVMDAVVPGKKGADIAFVGPMRNMYETPPNQRGGQVL